jgi:glycosyltransferase involved in cell wall biosynthesis
MNPINPINSSVSVIIPTYNASKYIRDALDSVIAQTYPVHEVIVVDDGSTDNTRDIVKSYVRPKTEDQRPKTLHPTPLTLHHNSTTISYIYQENNGPAAARNTGIRAATGDYIAFLDADDTWLPEKIEIQLAKLKENPEYALVHTNRIFVSDSGITKPDKKRVLQQGWIFDELLKKNFICLSTILVKRSCFDEIGYFDENPRVNRCEDYDMWLRIARKYQIGFIDAPLIKYRIVPKSHIRSNIKASYAAEKAVFLKSLEQYSGNKEMIKRARVRKLMYRMGHTFFHMRDYKQASSAFLEAVRLNNLDLKSMAWYLFSKMRMPLSKG